MTDAIVRMKCGHELRFPDHPPLINDVIYCRSCGAYVKVTHAPGVPRAYRARCLTLHGGRRCVYGYKDEYLDAVLYAVKRHVNKNGHKVAIYDNIETHRILVRISPDNVMGYTQEKLEILTQPADAVL